MMMLSERPQAVGIWRSEPVQPNPDAYTEEGHLLLLLVALWELQTGRTRPCRPLAGAGEDELFAFWADPLMEEREGESVYDRSGF
ncbi:hypothetical protein [Actinocorallia aurantiaca]|uniref:hypothetical protein n=1 Tax=Actinocorallia aurantiaca TaxID=46204 RepID=UPI0031DF4DF9